MAILTPIQKTSHGFLVKREDLAMSDRRVVGGKVRLATPLAREAAYLDKGLVGYGGRASNSAAGMAYAARRFGVAVRFHTATGPDTPEMTLAAELGATIIRHKTGYPSVLRARATADATERGGWFIGLAHPMAVEAVADQCENLADFKFKRVVLAVGSGTILAGVLRGLRRLGLSEMPVLGVAVGAAVSPVAMSALDREWESSPVSIETARVPYDKKVSESLDEIVLHPQYEAKLVPFLKPGDLVWNT